MKKLKIFLQIPLLILCGTLFAQRNVTLTEAEDIAIKNNGQIKSSRLQNQYYSLLQGAYKEVPATHVFTELGQVNSAYFDSKVGVEQSFLPGKYRKAQRSLYTAEYDASLMQTSLREKEIKRSVALSYAEFVYQREYLNFLYKVDSIYRNSLQRVETRVKAGEDNQLTLSAARLNFNRNQIRLGQEKALEQLALIKFRLLLNDTTVVPRLGIDERTGFSGADTSFTDHPLIRSLEGNRQIAIANKNLEQAKLAPSVNVGYYNNSFKGVGPDEKIYSSMDRMHAAMLGLQIPLFNKAQKEKIKAIAVQEKLAANETEWQKIQLKGQYLGLVEKQKAVQEMLFLYRSQNLNNMDDIIRLADRQLQLGEINYLQWSSFVRDAMDNTSIFLDLLRQQYQIEAELNYLLQP